MTQADRLAEENKDKEDNVALLRQYYTNFTAGELTPLLSSRIDADAYKNAVKTLRNNARIRARGGITRRPGLQYHQTLLNTVCISLRYIFDVMKLTYFFSAMVVWIL